MNRAESKLVEILLKANEKAEELLNVGLPFAWRNNEESSSQLLGWIQEELLEGLLGEGGIDMVKNAASMLRMGAKDLEEIATAIESLGPCVVHARDWDGVDLENADNITTEAGRVARETGHGSDT